MNFLFILIKVSTTRKDIEFQEEPLYQECPIRPKRDYGRVP